MPDEPDNGPPPADVVARGFEPLSTDTRALAVCLASFVALCGFMAWGLWALMGLYLSEPRAADSPRSAAPQLADAPRVPLALSVDHVEMDWQDLVQQRQREDESLRRIGCTIDPATGQPVLPASAVAAVRATSAAPAADPLRFPLPIPSVRAGAAEPLPRANVFPPVGAAATAEQLRPSGFDPAPGPARVEDLPGQHGPAARHDDPQARPTP